MRVVSLPELGTGHGWWPRHRVEADLAVPRQASLDVAAHDPEVIGLGAFDVYLHHFDGNFFRVAQERRAVGAAHGASAVDWYAELALATVPGPPAAIEV